MDMIRVREPAGIWIDGGTGAVFVDCVSCATADATEGSGAPVEPWSAAWAEIRRYMAGRRTRHWLPTDWAGWCAAPFWALAWLLTVGRMGHLPWEWR